MSLRPSRIRIPLASLAMTLVVFLFIGAAAPAGARTVQARQLPAATTVAAPAAGTLTNLSHLNFLRDTVAPRAQARHTTYRLDREPSVGVLWTYADRNSDGTYRRIGGGPYDAATNTYGQGAYNADDIARAAVVYVRHWRATGEASSRRAAYQLLRGLTYLQTASGPNAGNVVLWMQPDGTLNRSAEPKELPDPSDSGPSYWLARTLWALGEGYAAFRSEDPRFATFLRSRLDLSIRALDRQVLAPKYGRYQIVDGVRVPAWLIVDGADASSEAVLGLAAYVRAGGGSTARRALRQLADGIAKMSEGDARHWPYGALLPWGLSRSVWHAWGAQMPSALARAATALDRKSLLRPALADTAMFTPHLLVAGGPDNGWLPAPSDRTQIAYGADARLQGLLAVAAAAKRPGLRHLAGVAAAWYFGNNVAGQQMYDPATGRTFDGVSGDGTVNRNSGAESTIHGLLSMLALDARPDVAAAARVSTRDEQVTWRLVEAETGRLSGGATVVKPESAWTGESLWSNGAYVALDRGERLALDIGPVQQRSLVEPVIERRAKTGHSRWTGDGQSLGVLNHARVGAQGVSPAPGMLDVATLPRSLARSDDAVTLRVVGRGWSSRPSAIDAVLVQPEIEWLTLTNGDRLRTLLRSFAHAPRLARVDLPGSGRVTVEAYDRRGRLLFRSSRACPSDRILVMPGGFTLVSR